MTGFCEVADVAEFLQMDIPSEKAASVQRAIDAATAEIQDHCRQTLSLVENDDISLDVAPGQTRLLLPELPVVAVQAVTEAGRPLQEGTDYVLGQHGMLHRIGRPWAAGIQNVTVTYTHGYATLPGTLVDICTRAAARAYQAGLRAEAQEGVPGVQAESLGDHSVTYGAEGAGDSMVLGASAAPILLKSEKQALNRYRI
jgi:hypothetical protein